MSLDMIKPAALLAALTLIVVAVIFYFKGKKV
jgi:hypothetical protein